MTLHGASRLRQLRTLQFPAAMPAIFTGLQISAGLAVIGAIVGDFFFRQGKPGIGQLIDRYRLSLAYEQMYGLAILAAALGVVVFWFFGWLGRRVVGAWYEPVGRSRNSPHDVGSSDRSRKFVRCEPPLGMERRWQRLLR